jgi:two-component system nitrogen regulation response regulator NtrX
MIHQFSARSEYPLIDVNCAALSDEIIESELLGHEKGAFTEATTKKKGKLELAHQGTLFFDEIGDLGLKTQASILRILQEKQFQRVGGSRMLTADVRIISSTNKDLEKEIQAGRFREDLYYRLNFVPMTVPPLRERREDIPDLTNTFLKQIAEKDRKIPKKITPDALKMLQNSTWPGNVRELKNALEAGVVLCNNGTLRVEDMRIAGLPEIEVDSLAEGSSFSLEESERQAIIRALEQTGGVQKNAADLLGISRRAIHYKIKKYAIDLAAIKASGGKSSR